MMEELEENVRPRGNLGLVESSILGTLVPLETDINIEDALKGSIERIDQKVSPLAAIPQRAALFFDETVSVYVVLQTPYFDERTLKSYLGRLVISLEAQVVNAQAENQEGSPGQETIYNGSIQEMEDPLILVQGSEKDHGQDGTDKHILTVWRMSVPLIRPRLRLQSPSVVFSVTANLKAAEPVESKSAREEYLPSQVPSGLNLLESFNEDPALKGIKPRLSALRVSRVTPASQAAQNLMRSLKNISHQSIKVYPAINARVRYSRPRTAPAPSNASTLIASIDIEITPFTNCEVILKTVHLDIAGGDIEDLNKLTGMDLPIKCFPQDDVTFLYRIQPDKLDLMNTSQIRVLNLSLTATANLSPTCRTQITMNWRTTVDFTPPLNPIFGQVTQPIQRAHKPSQLSIGSETSPTNNINPDSLPAVEMTTRHQRNSSIPDFGVTMTFTGPSNDKPIYPGNTFLWSVFIVNRSDRPRKLALFPLPKRRRTESRITHPPSTGHGSVRKDSKIAHAVLDDNIVHAMQRNSALEPTEIVCLSTDTRVGPLAPSACYEVELRFMAVKEGVVGLEAVRVVDLGTQEHVDVVDLPTIVVASALQGGE